MGHWNEMGLPVNDITVSSVIFPQLWLCQHSTYTDINIWHLCTVVYALQMMRHNNKNTQISCCSITALSSASFKCKIPRQIHASVWRQKFQIRGSFLVNLTKWSQSRCEWYVHESPVECCHCDYKYTSQCLTINMFVTCSLCTLWNHWLKHMQLVTSNCFLCILWWVFTWAQQWNGHTTTIKNWSSQHASQSLWWLRSNAQRFQVLSQQHRILVPTVQSNLCANNSTNHVHFHSFIHSFIYLLKTQ